MQQRVSTSSNELANNRTELAIYRTVLTARRTLMAWIRTGISMKTFGYAMYKFLRSYSDQAGPNDARNIGLFLIGLGGLSILIGCIEYWQTANEMQEAYQVPIRKWPLIIAGLVGLLGVVLFLDIILPIF